MSGKPTGLPSIPYGQVPDTKKGSGVSIWWFALGYFACYLPYTALTKVISRPGLLPRLAEAEVGFDGFALLPWTALSSMIGMFVVITALGWWKYAGQKKIFGLTLPAPNRWTLLSGLCTAMIVPTTTLAYTFDGLSIVFMMLLMRGGVLIIAPIVDFLSKRKVRWFSWVALGLSMSALLISLLDNKNYAITVIAALDVVFYLTAYFIRLRFMSRLAKSDDENAMRRYFVEEQMVATPALVLGLSIIGLIGAFLGDVPGAACGLSSVASQFSFPAIARTVSCGFTQVISQGFLPYAIVIGLLSQGTGVFGGLILLDRRENSFCVPVNRAASILAGLLANLFLPLLFPTAKPPATTQLIGAVIIIAAILVLSIPPLLEGRRKAREAAAAAGGAPGCGQGPGAQCRL